MLLLGPLFKAGFKGLWVCPWDPEKAESSAFTCTDRKGRWFRTSETTLQKSVWLRSAFLHLEADGRLRTRGALLIGRWRRLGFPQLLHVLPPARWAQLGPQ